MFSILSKSKSNDILLIKLIALDWLDYYLIYFNAFSKVNRINDKFRYIGLIVVIEFDVLVFVVVLCIIMNVLII
jgi:hypothetical protein